MSKFKVGDRVRVVADTCTHCHEIGSFITLEEMGGRRCPAFTDSRAWGVVGSIKYILERDFEHVYPTSLHITTDGKTTHAVLKENGKVTKRAKADCSPDDDFDFSVGARLVFKRLFGDDVPKQIPAEFWERFKTEKIAVNCQTIQEAQDFLENSHKQGFNKDQTDYISHFADKKSNLCYRNYRYDDIEFYEKLGYTVITYTDLINGKLPKEDFEPYIAYDFNNKKIAPLGNITNLKDLAHTRLYTGDTVDLYNENGYLGECVVCGVNFVMSVKDKHFPQGRNGVFTIIKKRSYTEVADGEVVDCVKYIKSEGKNEK